MGKMKITNTIHAEGADRVLNVRRDLPDIRDRMYEPALVQLKPEIDNRKYVKNILDQKSEGSCTGHGLAAVINLLNAWSGNPAFVSSRRMLYEMAKKHDEWPGADYEGSSCRGAIRGWKNMGVCSDRLWPYVSNASGFLTIDRAIEARKNTLGAYYRLRPEIVDYHAAINEVGAIYVSARVHQGWIELIKERNKLAEIDPGGAVVGGHAFAIVGYTDRGFIVQNSWGKTWGSGGFALWLYRDWIENISDGWVFRLALPTPEIFGLEVRSAISGDAEAQKRPPRRLEIAGHFSHFDNGSYKQRGSYWSSQEDIEQTARLLTDKFKNENKKYRHLLIYAHGGLNTPEASARRIAALKEGFKRNGIYPFHIMYDTGLAKEVTDTVKRAFHLSEQRSQSFVDWVGEKISDITDKMIEDIVRKPVTAVWDEMKSDARWPFEEKDSGVDGDGMHTIKTFAAALDGIGLDVHLAGHSTGAVVLGHLLSALDTLGKPDLINSCNLMAPACTVEFYNEHYKPRLVKSSAGTSVYLPNLTIYNLNEELELDDNVVYAYRKSLLYLVSRALEREKNKPLLGMQKYTKRLKGPNFHFSNGKNGVTRSTSHGGFDNDPETLNHIMKNILGKKPVKPFLPDEMEGY
jgi:hypothetical protein